MSVERVPRTAVIGVALASLLGAAPLAAQYPHASVVPRGALRLSFEPELTTYDMRYGPDGELEPLGLDLSTDSAGPNFLPTLLAPQLAVRSITGDAMYAITAGAVATRLDADIRRFPLNVALGLTDRLTFTASLPIVTTRTQVDLTLDNSDANVGWNPAVPNAQNPAGLGQIQQLLGELDAGATFVEARIAAGDFGCPASATCDDARDAVMQARKLAGDLMLLTGVGVLDATGTPPFAPLAGSAAGLAVIAAIDAVSARLLSFGASAVTTALPLPDEPISADDINAVLTEATFGYNALPLAFAKRRNNLGDAEVGLRYAMLRSPAVRATLATTVRLPTGTLDSPAHFADLGTGDKQTDVVGGVELALEPGTAVALALSASYTLQLGQQLRRRITVPERPIALEAAETLVQRNLGDIVQVSVFPSLRLSGAFRVYLAGHYFRKSRDEVTLAGTAVAPTGFPGAEPVEALERETEMERLSLGGGVYYRSTEDRGGGGKLPIEAGIDYRTAFDGKGGLTPSPSRINFYLRLYFGLWGRPPTAR